MGDKLYKDIMYEHEPSGMVKCGDCWNDDISETKAGKYTGDEAVDVNDIITIDNNEPIQCEGCLKQNPAYESLGEDE